MKFVPLLLVLLVAACAPGEFCRYDANAVCGALDVPGTCQYVLTPASCPGVTACAFVCGCDGNTYCDECHAAIGGTSVASEGACAGEALSGVRHLRLLAGRLRIRVRIRSL